MQLDCLHHLVNTQKLYTVFISMPDGPTLPLRMLWFISITCRVKLLILGSVVSDSTTVQDIEHELVRCCLFPTICSIFQSMDHVPTPSRARIQWVVFLPALSVIFRYGVGFWVVQVGLIFRVLLILCQCETDIQFKQTSVHSTQTARSKTHHKYLGSMTMMIKYPSHLAVG